MSSATMLRATAAFTLICAAGAPASLAGELKINDVAPRSSVFVAGVDDYSRALEAFNRTGLRKVWDDPAIQAWIKKNTKESLDDIAEKLEEMGLDKDDIKPPKGAAGVAVWLDENAADPLSAEPGAIMLAEYGDEAEAMDAMVTSLIDKGLEKKLIETKDEDYNGVKVYSVTFLETEEEEEGAEGDEEEMEFEFEEDEDSFGSRVESAVKEMHYARTGEYLFISTDMPSMEAALDRVADKDIDTVSESDAFQTTMSMLGDSHGYATFLTGPVFDGLRKKADAEAAAGEETFGPDTASMLKLLGELGVTGVRSAAMSVEFDTDDAMLEQRYAVLAPEKKGLLSLVLPTNGAFTLPSFVSSDSASVSSFRFDFPNLIPTVRKAVAALPEEDAAQFNMMLGMAEPVVGPLLAAMGPDVTIVSGYARPLSATSQQQLGAIRVTDERAVNDSLAQVGAQMGLESREFQGGQIWSPPEGGMGMPQFGVGVGSGHMFIGESTQVENAMRQASQQGAQSLGNEDRFKTAVAPLKGGALAYTYSDFRQEIEWAHWQFTHMEDMIRERFSGMAGFDENDEQVKEWREEMLKEALKEVPEWTKDLPPIDVLVKNCGDFVGEVHQTERGFEGRSLWLRAGAEEKAE